MTHDVGYFRNRMDVYSPVITPKTTQKDYRPPLALARKPQVESSAADVHKRKVMIVAGHIVTGALFELEVAKGILDPDTGVTLQKDARALAAQQTDLTGTDAGNRAEGLPETAIEVIMDSQLG